MLLDRAVDITGSSLGIIATVPDRRYLDIIAVKMNGMVAPQAEYHEVCGNDSLIARVLESGQPISAHGRHSLSTGFPESIPAVHDFLGVPLRRAGEVVGLIAVAGRGSAYGAAELAQLEMLARAGDVLFECHSRKQQEARLAEKLQQSQKMEAVGTLASGVAHHFNNLLMIMMGNGELVLAKCPPGAPLRRNVEAIQQSGKRAAELIQQLLTFKKFSPARERTIDINDSAAETLKLVKSVLPGSVRLRHDAYELPCPVTADPVQLEQMVMNLVMNASEALPEGGEIVVETSHVSVDAHAPDEQLPSRPGRYVLVAVSDTGCGMAPERIARIFEPFFTTKDRCHGTGLGLFTVYGIVQQLGGHISVDSEPGRGSTFRVYLPRVEAPALAVGATSPQPEPSPDVHGTETIMVVEDDREVRHLVSTMLRRSGYTVLEAAHGGEALTLAECRRKPIDLLVTDDVMPHMSGGELARRLESLAGDIKVIFMPRPLDAASLAMRVRTALDGGSAPGERVANGHP
jgi:signal transduction histidine kinase